MARTKTPLLPRTEAAKVPDAPSPVAANIKREESEPVRSVSTTPPRRIWKAGKALMKEGGAWTVGRTVRVWCVPPLTSSHILPPKSHMLSKRMVALLGRVWADCLADGAREIIIWICPHRGRAGGTASSGGSKGSSYRTTTAHTASTPTVPPRPAPPPAAARSALRCALAGARTRGLRGSNCTGGHRACTTSLGVPLKA